MIRNCAVQIRRLTLDPAGWVPVIAPMSCGNVLISNLGNGSDLWLRMDADDPTSALKIDAGAERMIAAPAQATRFPEGAAVFCLKTDTGTGPVTLLWT